jgi:hypothetical protein
MDKMEKIIHAQIHYSNASTAWHIIYLFMFYVYVCYKQEQSAWKKWIQLPGIMTKPETSTGLEIVSVKMNKH